MESLLKFTFTFLLVAMSSIANARMLQIIHTNDLHSYFTGYYNDHGGYARVMTKIKQLRAEAKAKGIEVLQLDAGDWGEGTSFFLSDNGKDSIRALEMLGTDVATIGNHDHLVGGSILGRQIREAKVRTKFVAANLSATPEMNLGGIVVPYVDIEKAGIPIRIIGLTTDESYFQYSIAPGEILGPTQIGETQAQAAKAAGKELVIALTHIGVGADETLAANSSSIDVIVGGHTHTKLSQVDWIANRNGKNVPIVQAWAHGLAVGSLLLDVKDDGSGATVVDYKLHEVSAPLAADPQMSEFVSASISKRNANFTYKWDEVIGETHTPMTGYIAGDAVSQTSCWGWHMATAARLAADASLGVHISNFEGVYKPAGVVTYADIANNFPHFRKYGDQGWEIAKTYMSGWKLRPLMYWISRNYSGVTFSGMGYKSRGAVSLGPQDIDEKAWYSIAFPAEVALAINTSYPGYQKYLVGLEMTGQYYWPVMVDYIKRNSPISCD